MITVYYNNIEHKVLYSSEIEFNKLHRDDDLPAYIGAKGSQFWYENGLLHRDNDKPSIIWDDGSQSWYKKGKSHRDCDFPAHIWTNGSQEWFKNGERHRDGDLPAFIGFIGYNKIQQWYKNGQRYPLFSLKYILLQYFIRISYISRYNKMIWSPKNIAGIYTKNDLYLLCQNKK